MHSSKGHTVIPATVNSVVTVMSVGGLDTVVYSSVFNNQLSKEKQALICSSYQFHWCKYSHYDQFLVTKMLSLKMELEEMVQWLW